MILFLLKSTFSFLLFFIILSFEYQGQTLFDHMTRLSGPIGKQIQLSMQKLIYGSLKKTQDVGKELFNNANPRYIESSELEINHPELTDEEIKTLNDAIKKAGRKP